MSDLFNLIPPSQTLSDQLPNASKKKPKKKNKSSHPQPQPHPQLADLQQRQAVPANEKRDERSVKQPNPFKGIKPPQRSKSSSPEKMRKVLRQPHLRLPPQQHSIDASAQKGKIDGNVATVEPARQLRFRNRAGTAPNAREDDNGSENVFQTQKLEIERRKADFRGPSSRLRASTLNLNSVVYPPTRNPISYAAIRTGSALDVVPPRLVPLLQRHCTTSPPHSPIKDASEVNDSSPTDTSSGSDCDWYSCTSETSPVPNFTRLFRPRYPPDNPAEFFNSPVPRVFSNEHGIAIREELTKFHAAVYLVDEEAGGDAQMRMDGLRKVVDESMPTLRWLGLEPQNIVFFYHGRGELSMGFDVWEAMSLWGKRQREPRCQDPVSYQARKEGAEISMAQSCTLNVPARQQQKERPNEPCKQLVVDHEELSRNKKGTKKWVDFAEYQRLHGLEL